MIHITNISIKTTADFYHILTMKLYQHRATVTKMESLGYINSFWLADLTMVWSHHGSRGEYHITEVADAACLLCCVKFILVFRREYTYKCNRNCSQWHCFFRMVKKSKSRWIIHVYFNCNLDFVVIIVKLEILRHRKIFQLFCHLWTRVTILLNAAKGHIKFVNVTFTFTDKGVHSCVYLTFWHWSFTFNSNKLPTWCNNFSVYYSDVCLQLNMFWAFSRPSSGAQWLQWQPLVLPSYRDDSRVVFVVGPAGPTTNTEKSLHQVGDLFELNVKLRCQKVNIYK